MRKAILLFVLLTLFGIPYLLAQGGFRITGQILSAEDNLPVIGVSVVEKGTANGVITDIDGNYSITVSKSPATLQYSYVGMKTVEKLFTAATRYNVIMEPNRIMPDMELKVEVKDLPGKQVAYIRLNGGYKEIDYLGTWMRLLQFAKEQNIQPLSFSPICLYHDDPKVTSPDKLRTDICLEVAPSVCPKGEIGTKKVLEGRFMVALYKGTYQQLGAVYDTLYGKYLPEMGLSLREVPSGEIYLNDPRNTKPEDLLTQIYVAIE